MKNILLILALGISMNSHSQSSADYLNTGNSKFNNKDFKAAIKDYSKAIQADNKNTEAYFNRGIAELSIQNYQAAMSDLSKVIDLDPTSSKAYYNRAKIFVNLGKYVESLPDLDKTIELDPILTDALTLRGQIRAQSGNQKGACEDFTKVKELGDNNGDKYLQKFCEALNFSETFELEWPENEKWKMNEPKEDDQSLVLEYFRTNETLASWVEMGTMTTLKSPTAMPVEKIMDMMYEESKKEAPNAKLTFIDKDNIAQYPWIIFTIESSGFKNDKNPESQLFYITKGKTAVFSNFRAIKQASIPEELRSKWIVFFKAGRIITTPKK